MNEKYLNENIFYIPLLALKAHDIEIVKDEEDCLVFDDRTASIFYILIYNKDIEMDELMEMAKKYQATISVVSLFDIEMKDYGFIHHLKTRQYTYEGTYLEVNPSLNIQDVTIDDLAYLKEHYIRIGEDDDYLINAITRGMLKAVDVDGSIMGFIGEHPEHTMGLLYVEEKYRNRGIGRNLEYALINRFIKLNKKAIDHVVISNQKSNNLQSSIPSMHLDEGYFNWFF